MSTTPERDTVVQPSNGDQSIVDSQLPEAMQTELADVFPETEPLVFREWIDAWSEHIDIEGGALSPMDLQATEAGPASQEIRIDAAEGSVLEDGAAEFHGVLVPIVAALVTDDDITIETTCPSEGTDITLDSSPEGMTASPADAVVSFGVGTDVSAAETDALHDQLCSHAVPFSSAAAYENWAGERTDAVTVALPVEAAHDVALETYRAAERRALSSSAFHCNCC